MRGRRDRARAYADSAEATLATQMHAGPGDPSLIVLHALALAYLGRDAEAMAEANHVLALNQSINGVNAAYDRLQVARILIAFAPLKGNARFDALVS